MSDLTTPLPTHILLATHPTGSTWTATCTCGHTNTAPTYRLAHRGHVKHIGA